MSIQNERGREGEQLAVDFLTNKGYQIIHRNYRYLKAEIDIIASKGETLAIVEVKYRAASHLGNIAETVTKKKIKLLVQAADHYVTSNNIDLEVRFDIITLLNINNAIRIEHLEDAFYHF